jgi:hypothetical protein
MTRHAYCTPDGRPDTMDGKWMTYGEAAVRLGVSPEAARRRAIRGKWARMPGNDGRTRVQVPDELHPPRTPDARGTELELVSALRSHIDTLKSDIERLTAELAGERTTLAAERAARQADQEQHQDQLAAARAAADKATAELVELARRLAAIAETQAAAETAEAEPEPPRRSVAGRAWRWFLRN